MVEFTVKRTDHRGETPEKRKLRKQMAREALLQEIAVEPLRLVDRETLCAVPTLGGVLSDLGIARLTKQFPSETLLPVSERLAKRYKQAQNAAVRFVIVRWEGTGVAMLPVEAEGRGLSEARDWLPTCSGQELR